MDSKVNGDLFETMKSQSETESSGSDKDPIDGDEDKDDDTTPLKKKQMDKNWTMNPNFNPKLFPFDDSSRIESVPVFQIF